MPEKKAHVYVTDSRIATGTYLARFDGRRFVKIADRLARGPKLSAGWPDSELHDRGRTL